mgnify:FL=1
MTQNNVLPSQPINQRRLKEITNLPSYVIRHLKKTRQLEFQKVGTEDIFDETSVNRFMESFRIEDYLTIGECRKVLVDRKYYTERMPNMKFYYFPLNFYITVKTLIKGNSDIPTEYRLITKEFGKTQYVSKESFNRTLEWLDGIHRTLNQPKPTFAPISPPKPKSQKKVGLGGLKKIGGKKQQTPHPMVIPFMECPLSPLTQ